MSQQDALPAQLQVASRRDVAARALYQAELALHDAHETHVDAWIRAANDRLHEAVLGYLEANAALSSVQYSPCAA